jgi:hypothetical protein
LGRKKFWYGLDIVCKGPYSISINQPKGQKMKTQWKVTEAFGTPAQIQQLTDEAIGIAGWTGSTGATCSQTTRNPETGEETTEALVTIERSTP